MGKLLSFAIPCYNSAEYMEHCINTVLAGGDEVEVIIVDDGSTKDNTYEIAKRYEKEYPDIVKAVHQENGGHGEAVNTGLKHATGRFFKVVDSDDWVDGVEKFRLYKPDVVTMDITMPVMDGIEAVREIIEIDPGAKVIMVTAAGQKTNMVEALKRGAADFIQKPFDSAVIINTIEKVLEDE